MAARQLQKDRKQGKRRKTLERKVHPSLSKEKKEKLKALDKFIENILEEAGEDFLDNFKQVEGQ